MKPSTIRRLSLLPLALALSLATCGCLFFGRKAKAPLAGTKAAPDTVLFDEANVDIRKGRFTVARLLLQNLMSTYPDSEYLAKAKLAYADSYYRQGGIDGLTQAAAEYKDFITFFPQLEDAAFAQYRAGLAHFRMMEKPDRDTTQALEAEAELQTMILTYPHSQWTPDAEQRLREVQEVLAESEFGVAQFYYIRRAYKASAARLLELTERYPLFSSADNANWMLGQIYEKEERKEFAATFYANIVRDYPLSPLAPDARKRLVALGFPVPQASREATLRMQEEEKYVRDRPGILSRSLGILRSGPDVSLSAHYGQPDLAPETNIISAQQVFTPTVVKEAADSAGPGVGNSISATGVAPDGDSLPAATIHPDSSSSPASAAAGSGNGASAGAAGEGQAQSMKDLSKGPTGEKQNAKSNAKDSSSSTAKKKKKGLLHKIIPF